MTTQLEKKSILWVIVLSAITFGLYPAIWLWQRKEALNTLSPSKKINEEHVMYVFVCFSLSIGSQLGTLLYRGTPTVPTLKIIDLVSSLVGTLILILLALKIQTIFEEYFQIKMSKILCVIFPVLYLQYTINVQLEKKPPEQNAS